MMSSPQTCAVMAGLISGCASCKSCSVMMPPACVMSSTSSCDVEKVILESAIQCNTSLALLQPADTHHSATWQSESLCPPSILSIMRAGSGSFLMTEGNPSDVAVGHDFHLIARQAAMCSLEKKWRDLPQHLARHKHRQSLLLPHDPIFYPGEDDPRQCSAIWTWMDEPKLVDACLAKRLLETPRA